MNLVLDTNIIVGFSIRQRGAVTQLWQLWVDKQFTLILSEDVFAEVSRVLIYPTIRSRHQWSAARMKVFLSTLRHKAYFTVGNTPIDIVVPDDTDTKFLSCAVETQAAAIVSGDKHLLGLHRYQGIPILTAGECIERLFKERLEEK